MSPFPDLEIPTHNLWRDGVGQELGDRYPVRIIFSLCIFHVEESAGGAVVFLESINNQKP